MKLTNQELRQIIKEEVENILSEQPVRTDESEAMKKLMPVFMQHMQRLGYKYLRTNVKSQGSTYVYIKNEPDDKGRQLTISLGEHTI